MTPSMLFFTPSTYRKARPAGARVEPRWQLSLEAYRRGINTGGRARGPARRPAMVPALSAVTVHRPDFLISGFHSRG